MKKLIFLVAAFSALLVSCNNEDGDKVPVENLPVRIVKQYEGLDGTDIFTLSYTDRLLTGISKTTEGGTGATTVRIDYKAGQPTRMEVIYAPHMSVKGYTVDFEYNEQSITAHYSTDYKDVITVDSDGRVVSIESKYGTNEYSYDGKGNIIDINGQRDIRYDDRPGIFSRVETPQWLMVACLGEFLNSMCTVNNYLESYYLPENPHLHTKFEYRYNKSGFPVSATSHFGPAVDGYPQQIKSIEYK